MVAEDPVEEAEAPEEWAAEGLEEWAAEVREARPPRQDTTAGEAAGVDVDAAVPDV